MFWLFTAVFISFFIPSVWGLIWKALTEQPLNFFLAAASTYIAWRLFKYWGRFSYELKQAKKLISLKVIMPRDDSKIDQEKRTEKDFKEKIAVMEQLFRALWEVKSLNFWQMLHFWFFRNIIMSFELFLENGQLMFYVVTQPKLVSIVEKQVTSFYPNAEVTPEKTPDIWPKGTKLVGYHMTFSKRFYYPIRYYTDMQDDPLNGISNVLSKLNPDEKASVQIVLTPSFSNKWGKQARQYASSSFKGKKDSWTGRIPILSSIVRAFHSVASTDTKSSAPGASSGDRYVRMIQPEEELYKRIGENAVANIYQASIRIFASSNKHMHIRLKML